MNTIHINLKNTSGEIKPMNCVNNGPAGSRVRQVKGNFDNYAVANFPYARNHDASFYEGYGGEHIVDVHRIFKNFDADETDPASYVFEPTDRYLADTLEAGTKIFYRLGASIEHGYKYGTVPPKDFHKWARICEHIILHYNEGWADGFRYGIEYWEIWNEADCKSPDGSNPCWQGTDEDFFEFYEIAAKHLKSKFPNLKIGGPAFCNPWPTPIRTSFLKYVKEHNVPMDFYSFHNYTKTPRQIYETALEAEKQLMLHGLYPMETILDEYNYVRGWRDENWTYSLRSEKSLKGSSYALGSMLACQASPLTMLMYYESRPCGMCGLWNTDTLEPLKTYYSFLMFDVLKQLGTWVKADNILEDLYYCAATDGKDSAFAVTHFTEEDDTPAKELKIEFENASPTGTKAEIYLLDENNDMTLVSEQVFTSDNFGIFLNMTLFSSYVIKLKSL